MIDWFIRGTKGLKVLVRCRCFERGGRAARVVGVTCQRAVTLTDDGKAARESGAVSFPLVALVPR